MAERVLTISAAGVGADGTSKESHANGSARDAYRGERGRAYYRQLDASEFAREIIARERAEKLQPYVGPHDHVLEYGVGCGYNLRHLRCATKWGYDLNDAGRTSCEDAGIDFTDDESTLDGRRFDVVICHHVLEHVPDPLATLSRLEGYLAEGGRLLLFVPLETRRRYRSHEADDPNHHLYSWNVQSLGNLLALTRCKLERINVRPFSYERRLAPLARWGMPLYHLGLGVLRRLRREDEIFALLTRRSGSRSLAFTPDARSTATRRAA